MKKVLIVYKFLPEYRVDFYQQLRRQLKACNVELQLVYGKFNKTDALRKNEVEIDWATYVPNKRLIIGKTEILWQPCLGFLKDKDLIIVQSENRLLLNYYLMLLRHLTSKKLAFWGHVSNMQDNPNSAANNFKTFFIKKCDRWFSYTEGAKRHLLKQQFPENKITVVQNAIDTVSLRRFYVEVKDSEVASIKSQLGITTNNVGIYCGGMYPDKGFNFLLEACMKIREKVPDFHMLFVGSGIESEKIVDAEKKNNWIHFIGPKFGKDRVVYFKAAAVHLMPRLVGLCILDSFAMETPIITTDHPFHGPEIEYLENGVNGLVTEDDASAYSQKIIELLLSQGHLHLAENGLQSMHKYTVENMVENFKSGILESLS